MDCDACVLLFAGRMRGLKVGKNGTNKKLPPGALWSFTLNLACVFEGSWRTILWFDRLDGHAMLTFPKTRLDAQWMSW